MTEFGFIDSIKTLFAPLPDNGFEGIGDDCSVLSVGGGESLVFTPGTVRGVRRDARRGRHDPLAVGPDDQRHGHRPRGRRAPQATQRRTPRGRDLHRRGTRNLGSRLAGHPRGTLRHPRGRRAPQPAAAGSRRHLARQPSRGARHDGPFGRSGLRPEAYPRPLGRRRRSRRRADSRSPGRRRPHGRLLRRGLQTPAHRRAGGRRTPRR